MNRLILRFSSLSLTAIIAACSGHAGGGLLPPAQSSPSGQHDVKLALTVEKASSVQASAMSTGSRKPSYIPPSAQSVSVTLTPFAARFIVFPSQSPQGLPPTAACVNFNGGSSATLSVTAEVSNAAIVIDSWSGTCASSAGTGTKLTEFRGFGGIDGSQTDIAKIFNNGNPIALSSPMPTAGLAPASGSFAALSSEPTAALPMTNVVADPNNTQVMLASSWQSLGSGIYRTTNAGQTWTQITSPFGAEGKYSPTDLIFDPRFPSTAWAAFPDCIYQSTDDGASWSPTSFCKAGTATFSEGLGNGYADNGSLLIVKNPTLSTTNGTAWTPLNVTPSTGVVLAIASNGSLTIVANELGLGQGAGGANQSNFEVLQPSGSFQTVSTTPAGYYSDDLVIDGNGDIFSSENCECAGSNVPAELEKSTNGGTSFQVLNTAPSQLMSFPGTFLGNTLAASPTNGSTVYIGGEAGLYKTTDAGSTWSPVLSTSAIYSIQVLKQGGQDYIVAGTSAGVQVSSNGGAAWSVLPAPVSQNPVSHFAVSGSNLVAVGPPGAPAESIYYSTNAGQSWSTSTTTLSDTNYNAGVTLSTSSPGLCYAWGGSQLLVSHNYCASGTTTSPGGAYITACVNDVALNQSNPNQLYGAFNGGIDVSNNGGQSFTLVGGPANLAPCEVVIDPTNPNHLIGIAATGGSLFFFGGAIVASFDGGSTWTSTKFPAFVPGNVAISPANGNIVVAIGGVPNGNGLDLGAYASQDGGKTWVFQSAIPQSVSAYDIGAFPFPLAFSDNTSHPYVAVGIPSGLYISGDYGQTWTQQTLPSASFAVQDLHFSQGVLYLSNPTTGILKSATAF